MLDRLKEIEARKPEFEAELAAADNEYLRYAAARKQNGAPARARLVDWAWLDAAFCGFKPSLALLPGAWTLTAVVPAPELGACA